MYGVSQIPGQIFVYANLRPYFFVHISSSAFLRPQIYIGKSSYAFHVREVSDVSSDGFRFPSNFVLRSSLGR